MADRSTTCYQDLSQGSKFPDHLGIVCIITQFCVRGHFTVACYVTWPTKSSEARGDLALIQTSMPISCKLVSIRTTLHNKRVRSVSKQGLPPTSLSFDGQLTQQTTVKWSFRSINVVFFSHSDFWVITRMGYSMMQQLLKPFYVSKESSTKFPWQ